MKEYDWENAFPKPTEEFHEKLCSTLNGLEREKKMKRLSVKKGVIIAAAAVLVVGSAAFASSGAIRTISGGSSAIPDYRSVPDTQRLEDKMGAAPKIVDKFSNGYAFSDGSDMKNKISDEEGGPTTKFNSITCRYTKDGDRLIFSADAEPEAHENDEPETAEVYNGINIGYISYTGKFVPVEYELTEQDLIDQENGDVVFSYGTDEVEIYQIQGVHWEQDGIYYSITAMSSPLDKTALVDMAKEVIDF